MNSSTSKNGGHGALRAFLWAFALGCAIFVPLMMYNRGYFLFLGDFNVQQIPFYRLAHEMVRSGDVFWNWRTDLGANFIGSYSFYLLFSPFFWLTLPFPTSFVPHLMAPLLILKTACASLTGYLYIKRFVKNASWAVTGAVLYAFSGFMCFNIFFNHFHEPCIFFPLLLIALEELVQNDRRGFFCLMVAANCMVNYWFFIGEAVFVVIYVVVRMVTGGWGCTPRKFFRIAFESVLGVVISAVVLIPSALAIVGNPRTDSDSLITGWLMWIYGYSQRLPAIIQSFFFPPELPSRPNFFPEMGAKWASLSAWLPLFSTTGVIAFCRARKHDFHKRMIVISMIMALVPVFNSAFVMFNNSYYARWFYMPILMMCVATASALENRGSRAMAESWRSGWFWTAGFIGAFTIAIAFSPVSDGNGGYTFGLYDNQDGFWLSVFAALLCLLLSAVLIFLLRDSRAFSKVTCIFLSFIIVVFTEGYIFSGKASRTYDNWFVDVAIDGREQLSLPDEQFCRSDLYDCMDNLGMFWGLPNIQAFHSIVPVSIMEFYPSVGIKRDVSSKPGVEYEALRSLLSVKWLFIGTDNGNQRPMSGYSFYDEQLGYNIYKNDNFLPMGFAYDKAITEENMSELSGEQKTRHMLSALVLSDEAIVRNFDILQELSKPDYTVMTSSGYDAAISRRRELSCTDFSIDNRGFTARSSLKNENLIFFSVPYDKGWSATVNGAPAVIEKANIGFMAVRAPAGESVVRFEYTAPGLINGAKLSLAGLAVLLLYLALARAFFKKKVIAAPVAAPIDRGGCEDEPDEPDEPEQEEQPSAQSAPPPPAAAAPDPKQAIKEYLETLDELPPVQADPEEENDL